MNNLCTTYVQLRTTYVQNMYNLYKTYELMYNLCTTKNNLCTKYVQLM